MKKYAKYKTKKAKELSSVYIAEPLQTEQKFPYSLFPLVLSMSVNNAVVKIRSMWFRLDLNVFGQSRTQGQSIIRKDLLNY